MKRKGFTLIELIVVIAIIGILVLFGIPKYKEYTEQARITKFMIESKELEKASQKYYMSYNDWPRLSDEPYTSEEVKDFSEKIRDTTGKLVVLEENGNYYDIDYSKISNYIKEPVDKSNYILQNPVGSVYSMERQSEIGKNRQDRDFKINNTPVAKINVIGENGKFIVGKGITLSYNESVTPNNTSIVEAIWDNKKDFYTEGGEQTVGLKVKNNLGIWSDWVYTKIKLEYLVENQYNFSSYGGTVNIWEVPEDGSYRLKAYGAQGGTSGSRIRSGYGTDSGFSGVRGDLSVGVFELKQGDILYIYQGNNGGNGGSVSWYTGSYPPTQSSGGGGGGAGTEVRLNTDSTENIIISAKGGKGGNGYYSSGSSYGSATPRHGSPGTGGNGTIGSKGNNASGHSGGSGGGANINKGNFIESLSTQGSNSNGRLLIEKLYTGEN